MLNLKSGKRTTVATEGSGKYKSCDKGKYVFMLNTKSNDERVKVKVHFYDGVDKDMPYGYGERTTGYIPMYAAEKLYEHLKKTRKYTDVFSFK